MAAPSASPWTDDAKGRLVAEAAWQGAAARSGIALDILRIAGIYGPEGRNLLGNCARARRERS